jgi:WhiB family transcriptional regulator, redox-sensing transcriptional regulator
MTSNWRDAAVCGGHGDVFFGPDGETARQRRRRVAKAEALCAGCPVRDACLEYAQERGIVFGVFGGVDLEAVRPQASGVPVLCGNGLHLMTAENTKPVTGTAQVRCRECWRESDRRTRPARDARRRQRRREQRQEGRAA